MRVIWSNLTFLDTVILFLSASFILHIKEHRQGYDINAFDKGQKEDFFSTSRVPAH